ncbi:MAG: DUF2510 domain-containing protein [Rhodoglobus sp.]
MTNATNPTTPAGWYPDPAGSPRSRWWDGAQWTEHYFDPATQPYTGAAQALRAPEGTKPYTPWIWIIVFLPILAIIPLFFWNFDGYMSALFRSDVQGAMSALFSPAYFALIALSFVVWGLGVLFAYLDWKELARRSVPKPFHWGFAFIPYQVYAIGRSVVARRRIGIGIAPMWVAIAVYVALFATSIVWSIMLTMSMMSTIPLYNY